MSRPHPHRTARAVPRLLLGALALLAAACGAAAEGEPDAAPAPAPAHGDGIRLPLEDYLPSMEQLAALDRAHWVLTDQCMKRYGLRNRMPLPPEPRSVPQGENGLRYGLVDADEAAARGYGVTGEESRREPSPTLEPLERLAWGGNGTPPGDKAPRSKEESDRAPGDGEVNGVKVPVGGCIREATLALWMPKADSTDPAGAQSIDARAYQRSRNDSRVVKATDAWVACMEKKGYHAKNPVSPQKELGLTDPSAFTSPAAVAAATADVGCKRETDLAGIWYAVETAYQKRLIEQNGELLDAVRKQRDDALRLTAQLVAEDR